MFASPLPLCSWYFSAPLGVLWDFSCSVKSAAALMARPSRAVIQTSELLGYKPCPEFVLAGSSSRSHGDYLFISNLSEHGGMLSAGDPGTTRSRHLICAAAWHAQVGVKCKIYVKQWKSANRNFIVCKWDQIWSGCITLLDLCPFSDITVIFQCAQSAFFMYLKDCFLKIILSCYQPFRLKTALKMQQSWARFNFLPGHHTFVPEPSASTPLLRHLGGLSEIN